MLGLDVQEQSQLHPLESSLSNTVNHKWPILHVHFIEEPISNWDIKEQGDLTEDQKHLLPQTDTVNIPEFIQVPEITSCTGSQDSRGHYSLNSAVMLGTVDRVAPMDISSPQKMDLQDLVESSAIEDRGDFLEICIHPEVPPEQKDNHTLSEPHEAACMEDKSTEAGLPSEQNAILDNLQPERNMSSDVNQSNSSGKLTDVCNLMVTEFQNSFEQPLGGHEECTVVMSSDHTCLSNDIRDAGSCLCLEDQKVPPSSCTSHNTSRRNPDVCDIYEDPMLCEEASVSEESKCSDIGEMSSACLLSTSSECRMTENGTRPKQNCLEHSLQKLAQSKDICVQQSLDLTSCTEGQHKKHCLCTPLSTTHSVEKVQTNLEDVHSKNISEDNLLSGSGKCILLREVAAIQTNLNTSIDRSSVKSFDTQECTFLPSKKENHIHLQNVSADCHEDLDCANKLEYKLDEPWHASSIHLLPPKSPFGESSCKDTKSNLLPDDNKASAVHFRDSDTTGQEQKKKEQLFQVLETFQTEKVYIAKRGPSSHDGMTQEMHCAILQDNHLPHILNGAQLPVVCCTTQMPEIHSIIPDLGCNTIACFKIEASPDSVMRTKNDTSPRQQAESNIVIEVSDSENPNQIAKFNNTVLSSYSQSSEYFAINKTTLSSDNLKEVQCRAPTPECQSAVNLTSLEITSQNALVPYVDIWSFLAQSKVPNVLSLNSTKNMVLKMETSQKITSQNDLVPYVDIWSFLAQPKVPNVWSLNSTKNTILKKKKSQKFELRSDLTYCKESFLYSKTCSVPDRLQGWEDTKRVLLVHCPGQLDPLEARLFKCPDNNFVVPRSLFLGNSAWSLRVEKSDKGIPSVDPTISQTNWVSSSGSEAVNVNNLPACSPIGNIGSTETLKFYYTQMNDLGLQNTNTLAHTPLSSSHIVESTVLPPDLLVSSLNNSEIEHTRRVKQVVPIKHMVTRSRNKINYKGSSEYLHTMKPAQPSILQKDPTIKMKLLKGQSGKLTPPEVAVGTLKRKRICIQPGKTLPTCINKKQLILQHDQQLVKDSLTQSTYKMEVIKAEKSIEYCTLKLEPQSLTCTIEGAKRPKISHPNFGEPSCSDLQGFIATGSHKTISLHPRSLKTSCKVQKVPELPRNNYMTGEISLRRQPSRKCKNNFMQEYNVPNSNMQTCELSKAFHAHTFHILNHRSLPSKQAVPKMTSNTLYAEMIKKNVVNLNKCTAEQALLHQLSAIASRLTAPCKSSPRSMPLSNTTKLVPFKGVQLQARKLLNVFSCVNMKISSQRAGNVGFSSSRDHLLSQCMDLCPAPLAKACPDILAGKFSLPTLENPTFPVSFEMKIDPGLLSDFIKFNPPDYMFKSAQSITESAQLSEWTLSFFLSPHFPATSDDIQLFTHWNPHFRCLGTSKSDSSCRGKSDRKSGCSRLGLHTVLALSSPGCYRLWTRKRNLGSRIPTVQKLSVTQFAHGLKGLPAQFSWKREITSSLAFSLGRVMSMWSRHGLSAFFSDFATPHPPCSSWQPSQNLNFSVPVLKPSTNLIPKNCLRANEPRLQFNVFSWQDKHFRPSNCISGLSNHASCLFLEEGGGHGPSCSLSPKQVKDVRPLHCLPSQRQTHLFRLSTKQTRGLEPPQSLSTEQNDDLGHLHCLSIEQEDVLEPPNFLTNQQARNRLSLDSVNVFSTDQDKEFGPSSFQQEDALKSTHYLPLDQVNGCGPPCHLFTEQSNGHGPSSSLSTEQDDGLGHSYNVSIEHGRGLGPLYNSSSKQHSGIKHPHYLIAHQDVPRFTHSLDIEKGIDRGLSEVLSNDQGDGLKTSCFLSQADSLGAPLSLSVQKECEFGPCSVSFLKDQLESPCILTPFKTEARPFEQRESLPIPHAKTENQNQEREKEESERKPQRVSQIRIRKTIPKPDPNLTPMGLPKPKRINKKEFSLEDIYTNKNYKSPPPARSLETIFEEPKEKNGVLVSVSQTKRKRILEFRDCTMPRPKRAKGRVRVMTTCKRGRKAAMEGVQLDALLIQKLMDLENFLLEQEALERGSAAAEKPS